MVTPYHRSRCDQLSPTVIVCVRECVFRERRFHTCNTYHTLSTQTDGCWTIGGASPTPPGRRTHHDAYDAGVRACVLEPASPSARRADSDATEHHAIEAKYCRDRIRSCHSYAVETCAAA